ncbi:AfsR/SARP family transcriptional regulator [Saccharothrix australiensis]|uniref:DNA-binding SARP family transcriptional activator n=1 Tax=Saccharothrix australiensis TaxID=2072 RepID=A0A495VVK9_9PSEU|nr:BTAD domain-containing putative transcriptional regulator [Saccharothrix australiensis]RKT52930.1 DNA-binding SARP family transcriptional activator [Saccharothrix australiensis]
MAVEFRVLGAVEAGVDGRPVDLGPAKQRCVLAVLLVEANRWVPADRLLDRVWGEHVPRGRNPLYTYLSRLRRVLREVGGGGILRGPGGWRLAVDEDAVDLHRFHRLVAAARDAADPRAAALFREALDLWRGEPCAGLATPWLDAVREDLVRQRRAAELDYTDLLLRTGRHTEVLAELTTRAAEHPLDERVAGQLMLALYRSGRQADALAHYRRLRDRLADDLGADPGPPLRQLHQRMLSAHPALADPAPGARRSAATPRRLPAAPGLFTGRATELDALDQALADADPATGAEATVVISAIGGAGGLGKTWLALAWANRRLDRFPDGQLFVDLRGFSPTGRPVTPDEAVRGFLDALGVEPGRLPADPDARAARYRSLVADRRMLIVLDNAATVEQVVPLLPGSASCTVLVTSRNRLAGLVVRHGARPLHLDVLADAEARALLVASLGAARVAEEERSVAELVALCGGFPLALGLIAARARTRPRLPLGGILAELREFGLAALDDTDPAASLPAVLSWSLRRLTERQRTALALLGTAPGPDIGLPAAANLAGLPEREARAVLHALVDASLLDHTAGNRYAMHDLVRAFAADQARYLPEPVRQPALDRVVDFYLHTAHTAHHLVNPHAPVMRPDPPAPGVRPHPLPDQRAALAWLTAEHPHLLAAQHTAAAHGRHRTAWHLAWNLTTFHQWRGHARDELAVWQVALDSAEHLGDPAARIHSHRRLGSAHSRLGAHEEAIDHLHRALALAEHHHDAHQRALTHQALAASWGRRGDDRTALDHSRRCLDLYRALDSPVREADALNLVGWFAARLDDHDAAREHCRAALALHRRHANADGEANTLDSLGFLDHRTGRHEEAVRHYREALALRRVLGHTYNVANTLDRLGHPHTALGQHEQAREVWREALELYREQGRDDDVERVRRQLAETPGVERDH